MRATPLLLTDDAPVEVRMVVTEEAIELWDLVLRVDTTDGDPIDGIVGESRTGRVLVLLEYMLGTSEGRRVC
jgi:hypothetical protein